MDVPKIPDTDLHEKAKRYSGILQRFLSVIKRDVEKGLLTLSLPEDEGGEQKEKQQLYSDEDTKDVIISEVMQQTRKMLSI